MKRRSGFTLIELLVVVAIIAILAAILFPVFARAREKAKQASCQSNLKQIALAIEQYKSDWNSTMPLWGYVTERHVAHIRDIPPGYVYWFNALNPYVKSVSIFRCPSQWWFYMQLFSSSHSTYGSGPLYDEESFWTKDEEGGYFWGSYYSIGIPVCYTINGYLMASKESNIYKPDKTFMMWDVLAANRDTRDSATDQSSEPVGYDRMRQDPGYIGNPHSEGHNYAYADGHVAWVAWLQAQWQDDRFYNRMTQW